MLHVRFVVITLALAGALFVAMLIFLEVGRRVGLRQAERFGEAARTGVGIVDSAVYAVLALLLGFTFSGATTRFDHRRELLAEEVNAISTAWQRIDVLPKDAQAPIREGFRQYVDALLTAYDDPRGVTAGLQEHPDVVRTRDDIWARSVAACMTAEGEKARMLLLPSMNEMFDMADRERLARRMHPPIVIYVLLVIAALAAALFAGYSMANGETRNWVFAIGIAAVISGVTYVITEIEYPRLGVVRVDAFDQVLVEMRATMK